MLLVVTLLAALGLAAFLLGRDLRAGVIAAGSLAAACSAYLLARKLGYGETSICNLSDTVNCDVVNLSAASMLGPVPISALGLGWFGGVALAAGALPETQRGRLWQFLTLTSALQGLWCAWLGWTAYGLGAVCVLCLTIYVCVALIFVGSLRGVRASGLDPLDFLPALVSTPAMWVGASTVVAVTGAIWATPTTAVAALAGGGSGAGVGDPQELSLQGVFSTPPGPIVLDGDEPVLGRPDAPLVAVEFADFGCPHCAHAMELIHTLVEASPELQVRFRTYPLTGQCNPAAEDRGPERCHAAQAAECAHQQGKFWEFAELVFANQVAMSDDDLRFMARQVGVDEAAFETCFVAEPTKGLVLADANAGNTAGVRGTPSFFVRGPWGERWAEVAGGPEGLALLVQAVRAGAPIPEPGPPAP